MVIMLIMVGGENDEYGDIFCDVGANIQVIYSTFI